MQQCRAATVRLIDLLYCGDEKAEVQAAKALLSATGSYHRHQITERDILDEIGEVRKTVEAVLVQSAPDELSPPEEGRSGTGPSEGGCGCRKLGRGL